MSAGGWLDPDAVLARLRGDKTQTAVVRDRWTDDGPHIVRGVMNRLEANGIEAEDLEGRMKSALSRFKDAIGDAHDALRDLLVAVEAAESRIRRARQARSGRGDARFRLDR